MDTLGTEMLARNSTRNYARNGCFLLRVQPHLSSSRGSQRVRLSPACTISTIVSLACPTSLLDIVPLCITLYHARIDMGAI